MEIRRNGERAERHDHRRYAEAPDHALTERAKPILTLIVRAISDVDREGFDLMVLAASVIALRLGLVTPVREAAGPSFRESRQDYRRAGFRPRAAQRLTSSNSVGRDRLARPTRLQSLFWSLGSRIDAIESLVGTRPSQMARTDRT
jgi:hypothetical protein